MPQARDAVYALDDASLIALLARRRGLVFLLFLLAGMAPSLGALDAPLLLAYDDNWGTRDNPLIVHGFSYFFAQLGLPFSQTPGPGLESGHWAPLSFLSLAFDHALFGRGLSSPPAAADFTPWGFRLMSGLYHGLNGWLVFLLARRLLERPGLALTAAAAFLFHPTVCESTCWIIERNNLLPALFGLCALYVYAKDKAAAPAWPRTAAVLALLLLSQLSKVIGISWWFVLIGYDVCLRRESGWKPRLVRAAVLAAPCLLSAWSHLNANQDVSLPAPGEGAFGRLLTCLELVYRYFGLLLWPVELSTFYHVSPHGPHLEVLVAGTAGTAAAAWGLRRLGVPWARQIFYLLWICASVAPLINPFVSTAFVLQDRYLYMALPAFGMLLAEALSLLLARAGVARVLPAAALLSAALLALAIPQSFTWRHETSVYLNAIERQPASAFGHAYLASYLFHASADEPDPARRRTMLLTSLENHRLAQGCDDHERLIFPLHYLNEHATLEWEYGDRGRAKKILRGIVDGRPERLSERGATLYALRFLSAKLLEAGQLAEGLVLLERGLEMAPEHPELLHNRLQAWVNSGAAGKARAEAERLRSDPRLGEFAREVLERLGPRAP